jgi:alkylation response protein AidB-like acyl-CoA dehydrogenase
MSAAIEGARLLLRRAAFLKDQGRPIIREAAEAKLVAADMAQKVVTDALQIHGAAGVSTEFPLERLHGTSGCTRSGRARARSSGS